MGPASPLPLQARPLIGRARDVDNVRELLLQRHARLVTLVGPGGVGKTRLGLATGELMQSDFPDGVFFVDLSPVHDAALVLPTIARTLQVPDSASRSVDEALIESIGEQTVLLLLDNCEQVVGAAPAVARLLAGCPNLCLLASSREPLAISWEQLFVVAPLPCPPASETTPEQVGHAPAVALFVRQARAVRPSFELTPANAEVVADICRRLDGLPLAIELAAARVRAMSPETILAQLRERSLHVLSGGARDAPQRHRTLRDAIDWSYHLLEPTQQQLFRSLSVFVGGCTPEAIDAVAGASAALDVEALVDKHLLTFDTDEHGDGDIRYQQLETIREFGVEQLTACGGESVARERHARYLVQLAERAAPALYGPEQRVWLGRLLREHDNIRSALDWCIDPAETGRVELGLRLAAALWLFWRVRGFVREGRLRLAQLLDASASAQPSVARARALYAAGYLAFAQASAEEARELLQASVDLAREVGDPWSHGYALQGLGHAALIAGDVDQARVLYSERLEVARAQQDVYGLAQALNALGEVARCSGDIPRARAWYEQSLTLRRQLGDTRGVSMGLSNLGHVALAEGDLAAARSAFSESQQLAAEVGNQYGGAICLSGLAGVAVRERDAETAARLIGAADAILERDGISMEPADLQSHLRAVAEAQAALGAAQFASAYAAGKRLTLQDAATLLDRTDVVEAQSVAFEMLSARERQVAVLIARGHTSQEIADTLVITRRTADTHADHIRDKLGLRSRAAIAAWAERNGLLTGD